MAQPTQTETVLDRYIKLFDRAAHDTGALEELRSIYAPDATVQLLEGAEPVTGLDAIIEFYRNLAAGMADSKHIWDVRVLDDGRLECHWVSVARAVDGRLTTQSGIEHATLNADGLITNLRNRMVEPEHMS
jgi:SnoaL-like protein